jgi:TRAP-type mannitol/chloroaromatic compound transport system permease small subunit
MKYLKIVGWIQTILGVIIFFLNFYWTSYSEIWKVSQMNTFSGTLEWAIGGYLPFIRWAIFGFALMFILQGIANIKNKK